MTHVPDRAIGLGVSRTGAADCPAQSQAIGQEGDQERGLLIRHRDSLVLGATATAAFSYAVFSGGRAIPRVAAGVTALVGGTLSLGAFITETVEEVEV
jgi:hypothetical protein